MARKKGKRTGLASRRISPLIKITMIEPEIAAVRLLSIA
jgi:hypothetical protein